MRWKLLCPIISDDSGEGGDHDYGHDVGKLVWSILIMVEIDIFSRHFRYFCVFYLLLFFFEHLLFNHLCCILLFLDKH